MTSSFSKAKWAKKAAVLSFSFVLTFGASVPAAFAEDPVGPNISNSINSSDPSSTDNTSSPNVADPQTEKSWTKIQDIKATGLITSLLDANGNTYTIVNDYYSSDHKGVAIYRNGDIEPLSKGDLPLIRSDNMSSFAEYKGVLYAAYRDTENDINAPLIIKRFINGTWEEVGVPLTDVRASNITLGAGNDRLYLAYTDSAVSEGLTIQSYSLGTDSSGSWGLLEGTSQGNNQHDVNYIKMQVVEGQPFIMYKVYEGVQSRLHFVTYASDSSDTVLIPTTKEVEIPSSVGEISYATDGLGMHAIYYMDSTQKPEQVLQIKTYTQTLNENNDAWVNAGSPEAVAKGGQSRKQIALAGGYLYAAYYSGEQQAPSVSKYNGSLWESLPNATLEGIPYQRYGIPALINATKDVVYVNYQYAVNMTVSTLTLRFGTPISETIPDPGTTPTPNPGTGGSDGGSGGDNPGTGGGTTPPVIITPTPNPTPNPTPVPTPVPTTSSPVPSVPSTSAPAPAASALLPVIVGGKNVSALSSAQTSNVGGVRMTNFKLDEVKILSELPNSGNGGIIVPLAESANKLTGEISGKLLGSLRQGNLPLTIRTPDFSVKLPASGLNVRSASGTADVDAVYNIEVSAPSEAETESLNKGIAERGGKRSDLTPLKFSLAAGAGAKEAWNDKFENYAEYSVKLPTGVSSAGLTGVTLNPDGTLKPLPTRIIEQDGEKYAVVKTLEGAGVSFMNAQSSYADTDNHWSRSAVEDLSARQILNGESSGQFAPNRPVTRAEFAAAVVRAYALYDRGTERSFKDVSASDWYAEAVRTAAQWNLINGQSDAGFAPDRTISREEAAAILGRAQSALTPDAAAGGSDSMQLGSFEDSGKVSDWSRSAVEQMVRQGVIRGYDGSLKPGSDVTRGETAAMLQCLLSRSGLID